MKRKIICYVKRHRSLYVMGRFFCHFGIKAYFTITNVLYGLKNNFHKDPALKSVRKLKGIYEGKRCFVVATGPSLRIDDLEMLRDEITISMNSIVKLFDQTEYRPTIYMTQDNDFFGKSRELIKKIDPTTVYVGINDMGRRVKNLREAIPIESLAELSGINAYNLNLSHNYAEWKYLGTKWNNKFSFDCEKQIYDGGTVTYSAIQLAVYMGCKDIYLVGVDNGTKNGQKFHITDDEENGKRLAKEMNDGRFEKYQSAFIYAYNAMKHRGYNLYNATRGGALEGIPRVDLDTLLKKEKL